VQSKLWVILLNWNGWADTSACLSSLQHLDYANCNILVVDNGSTDDSVQRIRGAFPDVEVLESGRNLGFAGGCNAGIVRALAGGADYVWLLNNDTTVDPAAARNLVSKAMSDPRIGAVGSAIYFADQPERLQAWGGGAVNFWLGRSRHFLKPVPDARVEFITGASLLLTRAALEAIGFFDEAFFMYWEDADYSFRLRRSGWRLAVAGDSKVWHKGSASVGLRSAKMDTYFNASAARFFQKHAPVPVIALWSGVSLRLAKRLFLGDFDRARAVWYGAHGS
jgi:GT2 family glycosyltransferase